MGRACATIARLAQKGLKDDIGLRMSLENQLWEWSPKQGSSVQIDEAAADGLQQIREYRARMEAKEQQREQQRLADERKKVLATARAAELAAKLAVQKQAKETEQKVLSEKREVARAKEAALAEAKAEEHARNPDLKAKKAAVAAYRAVVRPHVLTIPLSSLPPLPQLKDPDTAVAFARALQALFEKEVSKAPNIHVDLVEQAITAALYQQCLVASSRGSSLKISPDEVKPFVHCRYWHLSSWVSSKILKL